MPNFKFTPKPHFKILPKPPKVRSFVFENDSRSKQDHDKLGREILDAILNNDYIYLMVDEGDGRTFWKYELDISGESLTAAQWNDEGEDVEDDSRAERKAEDNFDNYRRGGLD